MKSTEPSTVAAGIDISKAKLDVAFVAANTPAGWQNTAKRLQRAGVTRVGMEATGGYERGVARCLRDAGFEVVLLQPLQVKAFAQARLQRAKTDPLDAALIAAFTHLVEQPARTPPSPEGDALADHLTYLESIEDDIARLKTRLEHVTCARIRRTLQADIKRLQTRRAAELGRLDAQARTCPERSRRLDLVLSIPSIGLRTALALVLRLPERGKASREQAAALAGLAPFTRQSGKQAGETSEFAKRIARHGRRTRTPPALLVHGRLCRRPPLEPGAENLPPAPHRARHGVPQRPGRLRPQAPHLRRGRGPARNTLAGPATQCTRMIPRGTSLQNGPKRNKDYGCYELNRV